jgi:hypothetical protein
MPVSENDFEAIQLELVFLRSRLESVLDQNLELRMSALEKSNNFFSGSTRSNLLEISQVEGLISENERLQKRISEIEASEIWKILRFFAIQLNALNLNQIIKKFGMRIYKFLLVKKISKIKS